MAGEVSQRITCAAVIVLVALSIYRSEASAAGAIGAAGWGAGGSSSSGGTEDCSSCTIDYSPVCASNATYANKCYAECQVGKGAWTPGRCPQDELNPVAGCIGVARCADNPCERPWPSDCQNPLPADAVCFLNACNGIEFQGELLSPCQPIWVDPTTKDLVRCNPAPSPPPKPPCRCTKEYMPVCGSNGRTYGNKCQAACELGLDGSWKEGPCPPVCPCPKNYAPVCGSDGVTYGNPCQAACVLGADGAWKEGPCRKICTCTKELFFVCGSDGKTYNNQCEAACNLGSDGNWTVGACEALNPFFGCLGNVRCKRNPCDDGCADAPPGSLCFMNTCTGQTLNGEPVDPCTAVWADPVTRTAFVCPSSIGGGGPRDDTISCSSNDTVKCFADPCQISSCPADPTATCLASYCSSGTFQGKPVGPCEAVYVNMLGSRVNCTIPDDDIYACSPNSPRYMCKWPPACEGATCPGHPNAQCISKPCTSVFHGEELPGCLAIWFDPEANELVQCGAAPVPHISCPDNDTVACFADPCKVSSCPADPSATCLASYCSNGTFQGRPVGPCEAVYVNSKGNRVDCSGKSDGCICTMEWAPVCAANGQTYGNPCMAHCEGQVVVRDGECGDAPQSPPSPPPLVPAITVPAEGCVCTMEWNPQCGTNNRTYGNPCEAACERQPIAYEGMCAELPGCADNETVECVADPCSVSSCPAYPDARCLSNYCRENTFGGMPVGPCEAVYVDQDGRRVDCNAAVVTCTDNVITECFDDPCQFTPCPANPSATCLVSYCWRGHYHGERVSPCETIFVDANNKRVNCTASGPYEEEISKCAPQEKRVSCSPESQMACYRATCPSHPNAQCVSKPCRTTFKGVELPACSPFWFDPDTNEVVQCGTEAFARDGCFCPYEFDPVCARYNRTRHTFPSRCAARCVGAALDKYGKCQHCNGHECEIGKLNDICFLGAPSTSQCWNGKYECQPTRDLAGGAAFLGKCLPKQATTAARGGEQSGHRHRRQHRHLLEEEVRERV